MATLLPAIILGENIECDSVSDDLYYHFDTMSYLLAKVFRKGPIRIIPKRVIHLSFEPKSVATGFSGGIDSLATYLNHTNSKCPEYYKITHLTLFNVGSYGNEYELTQTKFVHDVVRAKKFSEKVGLPLVTVNSNIGCQYNLPEIQNYSLRSILCLSAGILSLSKLFRPYYISSTGTIDDMKLSKYDEYFYENSLTQLISNHCTSIFITEGNLNRVKKTKIVTDSPLSEEYLYVCAADIFNERFKTYYNKDTSPNCSECVKCVRTLMTIDALGR